MRVINNRENWVWDIWEFFHNYLHKNFQHRTFDFKLAVLTFKYNYNVHVKETMVNIHLPQFFELLFLSFLCNCEILQFLSVSLIHAVLKGSSINFCFENSPVNVLQLLKILPRIYQCIAILFLFVLLAEENFPKPKLLMYFSQFSCVLLFFKFNS